MEIVVGVEELQEIFGKLANVVRVKENDLTSMVLLHTKDDKVYFKASNQLTTVVITVRESKIISPGKVLFKLQDLKSYINKFIPMIDEYGTENFHFIVKDGVGFLKTKTLFKGNKPAYRKLKFSTFDYKLPDNVKEFPESQFILNSNILKLGINRVLHCINAQDIRKALAGIHTALSPNKITFTGTDGVKLSEFIIDVNTNAEEKSYIFRYDFAFILKSILSDDAQVFINIDNERVYIKSNNIAITGSLVLGEVYPDYKAMFNLENRIQIPLADFYDAVHITTDVLDAEDNHRLSLKFSGNTLVVQNDVIDNVQEFDTAFDGELDINVNGLFLESILRTFKGDNLEIIFTPGLTHVVFRSIEYPNQTALLTVVRKR